MNPLERYFGVKVLCYSEAQLRIKIHSKARLCIGVLQILDILLCIIINICMKIKSSKCHLCFLYLDYNYSIKTEIILTLFIYSI